MTVNRASARYEGLGKDGRGHIWTGRGALDGEPYGFASRFEDGPGTNPEELIAAAHAACFTMALSVALARAGHSDGQLDTRAEVTTEKDVDGLATNCASLTLKIGRAPGRESVSSYVEISVVSLSFKIKLTIQLTNATFFQ